MNWFQVNNIPNLVRDNWRWLLVLSVLALFISKSLYHVPLIAMAVLGLIYAVRDPRLIARDPSARLIAAIFIALWLPQLLALPDAVAPAESFRKTSMYIFYPLAVLFMYQALSKNDHLDRLMVGIVALVLLWSIDVLAGTLGLTKIYESNSVVGILFSKLRVGHILAVLSPLVFEFVRQQHARQPWVWLLLPLLIAVILISGRRVAWIILMLSSCAYLIYLARTTSRPRWGRLALPVLCTLVLTALLYWRYEPLQERMHQTIGVFSNNIEDIDRATSRRVDIWINAYTMAKANWLNGIGVRGFRYVYVDYATADNFWIQQGLKTSGYTHVTHPHQFVLEIAAETGLIGLLGYLLVWWLLWRALKGVNFQRQPWAWPCAIALGLALFPLNAHSAFYGSYWSAMSWWLIGLTAGALRKPCRY